MTELIFAGIDLSSGRKPVTLATLDETLNIICLEKMDADDVAAYVKEASRITLALNVPSAKAPHSAYSVLKKKVVQLGLKPYAQSASKQFFDTDAQDTFRALIGNAPLLRRTFEGRVQRALILYEQGVRIKDPMDFFEEITRYHMLSGVFPNELINSTHELDALAAAYVAWLAVNEAGQVETTANKLILPKEPERD